MVITCYHHVNEQPLKKDAQLTSVDDVDQELSLHGRPELLEDKKVVKELVPNVQCLSADLHMVPRQRY